jgi:transcription initiation factor IIE alpha subunit
MSVDIEDFEAGEAEERTNADRVLAFLADRDDRAWTAAAIAERTDVDPDSINPVLTRLKDRGLVRHERPYWAITDDDDRLRDAVENGEGPIDVFVDLLPEPVEELLS